ncbi:amino acid ABC transporter substrate-binding protein [Nodosilinea sp. LEGE 07088]|nr:amino acid ABC transporter substrate-binding protein [Nodosilinea sp. LEGE 07088]
MWWLWRSPPSFKLPSIFGGVANTLPSSSSTDLSQGDTVFLTTSKNTATKDIAASLIAKADWAAAKIVLQQAVAEDRNDPEALIYFNNARAYDQGNPLAIAVVVPLSSSPDTAQEMMRGVAQAQQDWNDRGGVVNRLLAVTVVNDGNDPERAAAVAKTLADRSEILAVVGHNSSSATIAAAETYQAAQLLMVSPTSSSTQISQLGNAIFRTVPSDQLAATQLARYSLTAGNSTFAVAYNSESGYSTSFKDAFTATVLSEGGTVVDQIDLATDPQPAAALQRTTQSQAQVLMLSPNVDKREAAIALATANAALPEAQRMALLGSDSLYTYETLATGRSAVANMVLVVPWHPNLPASRAYAQAAEQLWGGRVSWRTALSYDATEVILQALTQSRDLTRSAVLEAVNVPGFTLAEGASGSVQFMGSGDRSQAGVLVKIVPSTSYDAGFDFQLLDPP